MKTVCRDNEPKQLSGCQVRLGAAVSSRAGFFGAF